MKDFRLEQRVLLHDRPFERWNFRFGFVMPGSTNTWQQVIEAADEMLPVEVSTGTSSSRRPSSTASSSSRSAACASSPATHNGFGYWPSRNAAVRGVAGSYARRRGRLGELTPPTAGAAV